MPGRGRTINQKWVEESKIPFMNSEDADLHDKMDENHFEDAQMEHNVREQIDSNECQQEEKEALLEEDKEINEHASDELHNEVNMEDDFDSDSVDAVNSSNKEEESGTNEHVINYTSKENNKKGNNSTNPAKRKQKTVCKRMSNKNINTSIAIDDYEETDIVPYGTETDDSEIIVATPENNVIHQCYVRNMTGKIYHPENKINQNENVVVIQIPIKYLNSSKPKFKEAPEMKNQLTMHNPHMEHSV